jgi:MtN3 and saliva related transmembrane protein
MMLSMISPQVIGLTAGVLTATSLLPQFLKILKEKKADDLSVPMLLILLSGVSLWIYYGVLKDDLPIILTNSFSLTINLCVIFLRFKYRNADSGK